MTVNVPLLRKVLEHITAHPEEWDQEQWGIKTACGTACCVAGHVAVMTGHALVFDSNGEAVYVEGGELIASVAERELNLLDLDDDEPDLFLASNRLSDLWEIANRLTDGEIRIPEGTSADV